MVLYLYSAHSNSSLLDGRNAETEQRSVLDRIQPAKKSKCRVAGKTRTWVDAGIALVRTQCALDVRSMRGIAGFNIAGKMRSKRRAGIP
jgi:hypothetical protein